MTNLNDVALFAAVVEAGSFSAAARRLGIPKATVSRNVARLEAGLGARLLNRTTRKLELTAQGRSFHAEAARGLAHLDAAREQIAAAQAEPAGPIRITAPEAFGTQYLMQWIPEFLQRFGRVSIELRLTDGFVDLIEERIDIAFRTGTLPDSSLVARRLAASRRVLVAAPDYLRIRGIPRRPDDLRGHDCVVFASSLDNAVWRLEGPGGVETVPVDGRLAADSAQAARRGALAGLGIALLPLSLVAADLRNRALRRVLPDHGVDGGLFIVYPSNRLMPAALRAFVDFAAGRAGDLPG